MRKVVISTVSVALCSVLVACGSSSKSTSSGPTPSGRPLQIVSIQDPAGDNPTYVQVGLTAAVDSINASGGINGRPIKFTVCNTHQDPNLAATCARKAASDSSVLAVVDDDTTYAANVDPVLESSNLPSIGNFPNAQADFKSKMTFNLSSGSLVTVGEALLALDELKATRVGLPYVGVPSASGLKDLITSLTGNAGVNVVSFVAVPPTAVDVTSEAAAVASAKPAAILQGLATPQFVQFIKTYREAGGQTPFVASGLALFPHILQTQLKGIDGLYSAENVNTTSAGYHRFLADVGKYQSSHKNNVSDYSSLAWLGVQLFKQAVQDAANRGAVTRARLVSALNAMTGFTVGNMIQPVNFSDPQRAGGGAFPRIQNPYFYPMRVSSSASTSLNKYQPISVFSGL